MSNAEQNTQLLLLCNSVSARNSNVSVFRLETGHSSKCILAQTNISQHGFPIAHISRPIDTISDRLCGLVVRVLA
jgi:hypothetical protein